MTDNKPRDPEHLTDQDKPINVPNAADARPDGDTGPDVRPPHKDPVSAEGDVAKGRNQNLDAKKPHPGRMHQEQRSQGMNHSE